jgi:uncharacterized protein (DUF2249 family)
MQEKIVRLDVREDIRRGREPFSKIMQAVAQLGADESLLLIAPFEPKPLFAVLGQQGFFHNTTPLPSGDWEVLFSRSPQTPGTQHSPRPTKAKTGQPKVIEVDARGLEPPQPLVKILEALEALPDGAELRALTDRRPMHLYAQLEERGFTGESEEQSDGSFITRIHRC